MILKSLIFINSFALLIGALLVVLDRVIATYGDVTITINDDKELTAPGGKNLLRILFESKYFIPSACGGKGTCGYCKLEVSEGGGEALPTEALILNPVEIRKGFRLACQLKVRNDLRIKVPPEYLEIKEYEGEIEYSQPVTSDIRKIGIRILGNEKIRFKPGQYVQIRFDTDDGVDYRAYSISSNPDEDTRIELNVKLVPEGIGSSYLHSLKEGDPVYFSGPYGEFFLNTDSSRKIICVAGGVGLAPIKSIIDYWETHLKHREVEFYYGSRTSADLYDHDIFSRIAAENPNFHYYPALSSEDPRWEGARGFVHDLMKEKMKDVRDSEAYLCGPPVMIDAVTGVLVERGIPGERILFDKF